MKKLTYALVLLILAFSLFEWMSVKVTNQELGLVTMLLLLALFSELKEFNFFGLQGKKLIDDSLIEQQGLPEDNTSINQEAVEEADNQQLQLMDNTEGNFLKLAFEIERLLKVYANVLYAPNPPKAENIQRLIKKLHGDEFITEVGLKQLEAIRWLRNQLVHSRHDQLNMATLKTGEEIALSFYQELYQKLYGLDDGTS